jgi:hypothetical protein
METNSCINTLFQVLNALGSLATFCAFIFLFFKDRQKQDQIDRLANIGDNIKEQNEMLDQSNKLLDEQVGILRRTLTGTLLDDAASKRLAEIESQKLLLSIKPRFIYEGATFGLESSHIKIRLKNKGNVALLKSVISEADIISVTDKIEGTVIEKDQIFNLPLNIVDRFKANKDYTVTLIYTDQLKNEYQLNIIGKGQSITLEE